MTEKQLGPVEVLVVGFPDSEFNGSIAPALRDVVERGDVSIIDLALIVKDGNGDATILEVADSGNDELAQLASSVDELLDLLNEDDLLLIAESLEPGSSAAAVVFEHRWARELAAAARSANGELLLAERVPQEIVAAAVAAIDENEEN